MNCRLWVSRVMFAVGAASLFLGAKSSVAAPLDNRVPADALMYVGWQGAGPLESAYATSNLKGVMDASTIPAYVEKQLGMLSEKAAGEGPEATEALETTQKALGILWRHPAALYVGPVEFPAAAPGQTQIPKFRIALLSEAGPDAKNLEEMLQGELKKHPTPPEARIDVVLDGDVVIITFGDMHAAKVDPGFLADSAAYKKAMANVDADGALMMYVNGKGMIATAADAFAKVDNVPPEVRDRAPVVIEALGLNGLGDMAYSGKFEKKGWKERSFVGTNGARTGLLALADTEPVSDAALALVPADAMTMNTGRLDLTKVLALVRDIAAKVDPQGARNINRGLAMANMVLGFDIEKDLINPLGDEWVAYRWEAEGNKLSMALVQRPRDAQALTTTFSALEELVNSKGGGRVKVEKVDGGNGVEVSALRTPQFSVAWAVRNGVFYVATVDGAVGAVKQVEEKKASITTNPAYQAAMAELPVQKGISINYGDPAKLYPEIVKAVGALSPLLKQRGIELPADLLPDAAKAAPFMKPGADITWSDANGFYSTSVTAFPGAGVVTGQQGSEVLGIGGLGLGMFLPSMGRSRELATRSVDLADARGVCQACVVWASNHNDKLPDHLGKVLAENMLTSKQLVSRRGTTPPLEMTPEMLDKSQSDYDAFCRDVDAHCDWVYLGNGMGNDTDSTVVLVYEKPAAYTTDGLAVGFQDGHAELVGWMGVRNVFGATNAYLKKKGLREVDVEELMKGAPEQIRNLPPASMP